jgi:hypothetical protein
MGKKLSRMMAAEKASSTHRLLLKISDIYIRAQITTVPILSAVGLFMGHSIAPKKTKGNSLSPLAKCIGRCDKLKWKIPLCYNATWYALTERMSV